MSVSTPIFTPSSETPCACAAAATLRHSAAQIVDLIIAPPFSSGGDGRLTADRRLGPSRFAGFELEREFQSVGTIGLLDVIADQRAGDAELAVGLEIGVLRIVDLGGDRFETRLIDQEMHMRRPEVV